MQTNQVQQNMKTICKHTQEKKTEDVETKALI